jgi:hypothetical protein
MRKMMTMIAGVCLGALIVPQMAFAGDGIQLLGVSPLKLVISMTGLGVAMILLVEVIMLRKIALGGAIADRISYVVLAIVCLGASALAQWTRNFVTGLTLEQVQIAAEVLVIAGMGLFVAYFSSVRRALEGFMKSMTGGEMLREEISAESTDNEDTTRG